MNPYREGLKLDISIEEIVDRFCQILPHLFNRMLTRQISFKSISVNYASNDSIYFRIEKDRLKGTYHFLKNTENYTKVKLKMDEVYKFFEKVLFSECFEEMNI